MHSELLTSRKILSWENIAHELGKKLHIVKILPMNFEKIAYSAAGDPDITIYTDAVVAYDGCVLWQPPAIYKSFHPASFLNQEKLLNFYSLFR